MPYTLPGTATDEPNLTPPSDSDPPLASGYFLIVFTQIANVLKYLKTKMPGVQASRAENAGAAPLATTSSTYSEVTGSSTVFTAEAGDRIKMYVKYRQAPGAGTGAGARLKWYNPDASQTVHGASVMSTLQPSQDNHLMIVFDALATQTGVHNLYLEHSSLDNATSITTELYRVVVEVIKP